MGILLALQLESSESSGTETVEEPLTCRFSYTFTATVLSPLTPVQRPPRALSHEPHLSPRSPGVDQTSSYGYRNQRKFSEDIDWSERPRTALLPPASRYTSSSSGGSWRLLAAPGRAATAPSVSTTPRLCSDSNSNKLTPT
ncbi:unnamed protein product [Boreogadus saida]